MNDTMSGVPTTRLYGGAIGVVSGGYAVARSVGSTDLPTLAMLLVGLAALFHGLMLFTDVADRLDDASGPLMVVYAVLMLALQAWAGAMAPQDPGGGMGMGETTQQGMAAGVDGGMVALALLMLFSGAVMTTREM